MTVTPFVDWPAGVVLTLASTSPRRAELLKVAGIPFRVVPAGEIELAVSSANGDLRAHPAEYALKLAEAKAAAVADRLPGDLVLGADTVVVLGGEILEKPADAADAVRILRRLAGRRHRVITGMALQVGQQPQRWTGFEETTVEFLPLAEDAIARYVATGEPFDKAGAYGIQGFGALMVRRVEGCYFNVMGLPLARLGEALRALFGQAPVSKPGEGAS